MFNNGNGGFSLADIAAACRGGNGNGFGGGEWWIVVILMAMFGWGGNGNGLFGNRNGNGNNCGSNGGGTNVIYPEVASMQRGFDTSTIIQKLDGLNSGLCSLGYDQLNQMNGINQNINQASFGLQQAINNASVTETQNSNMLANLFNSCCCELRAALKDVQYTIGQDACVTQAAIHEVGDRVIQGQNWGFRNLQDTINAGFQNLERQADQRYIRELEGRLNSCDRNSELQTMANYIINTVQPRAVPAYPSCNPNGNGNWSAETLANVFGGQNGYGNRSGCCNNNNNCCYNNT